RQPHRVARFSSPLPSPRRFLPSPLRREVDGGEQRWRRVWRRRGAAVEADLAARSSPAAPLPSGAGSPAAPLPSRARARRLLPSSLRHELGGGE
ncbi:Os03g0231400, partial [Oryza sativa Japonica Group]